MVGKASMDRSNPPPPGLYHLQTGPLQQSPSLKYSPASSHRLSARMKSTVLAPLALATGGTRALRKPPLRQDPKVLANPHNHAAARLGDPPWEGRSNGKDICCGGEGIQVRYGQPCQSA